MRHWLMPISCHFRDCKALLVTSLTHVSGAIASVETFTLLPATGHIAQWYGEDVVRIRVRNGIMLKGECLCCSVKVNTTVEASKAAYRYGDSVITGHSDSSFRAARPLPATASLLGVPQPSLSGLCSHTAPVRFLQESSSSCVVPLTEESCSESGPLSARLYADSSRWGAGDVLDVLVHPTGEAAPTDVSFICVKKSDFERHSRASTSANAPQRSYSLFTECPPKCHDSSSDTLPSAMPLAS